MTDKEKAAARIRTALAEVNKSIAGGIRLGLKIEINQCTITHHGEGGEGPLMEAKIYDTL